MNKHLILEKAIEKIKIWAESSRAQIRFNPPASPDSLEKLKASLHAPLPEDLLHTLSLMDGENWRSCGLIGSWHLMSIEEILSEWQTMAQLAADGVFGKNEGEAKTPPYINNFWWNPQWIPIVSSGSGHFYCLDTDPPSPDRFGQVLLFLHDQPQRYLVAGSLSAWFRRIAHDLEAGLYQWDAEHGFNNEALMWSSLEGKHIFDDIPGRRVV
jgi:cell wall assembly regulator SMI1